MELEVYYHIHKSPPPAPILGQINPVHNPQTHFLKIILYKSQQDAHVTELILSDNCSTYFGRYYQPSSGAQTTVTGVYATHSTLKTVPTLPR